ncbi:hypothetical protein D1BOALGB6SA_2066 [Olavius sp. associated proteobacterium Delta 1]|nr:hypothetical protein D1BOALGB6SA_2066 [Olavius sp. associated proteobacterium Delta 1]
MNVEPSKVLDVAVSLYTYAGNNYATQWNLVSVVVLGYLSFFFTELFNKLTKVGHYILLSGIAYYFYLSSTWVLQSIKLLDNSSEIIQSYTNSALYDGMATLSSCDVIWIHRLLAVIVILVAVTRIHHISLKKLLAWWKPNDN